MTSFVRSYAAYRIGRGIACAITLAVVTAAAHVTTRRTFLLVFLGWVIGWRSATIAGNVVDPPPKSSRLVNGAA